MSLSSRETTDSSWARSARVLFVIIAVLAPVTAVTDDDDDTMEEFHVVVATHDLASSACNSSCAADRATRAGSLELPNKFYPRSTTRLCCCHINLFSYYACWYRARLSRSRVSSRNLSWRMWSHCRQARWIAHAARWRTSALCSTSSRRDYLARYRKTHVGRNRMA